ncbi:MAG: hypothetical protein ACUVTQ_01110 [Desulfotomaculales bacterium]
MWSGFWRGVVTGGLIGAVVSMFMLPRRKAERAGLLGTTRRVRARARRVLRNVSTLMK